MEDSVIEKIMQFINPLNYIIWLTDGLEKNSGKANHPTKEIDPNTSLGELRRLHLKQHPIKDKKLSYIAQNVPRLTRIGTFHYEDIVRRLGKFDFNSWYSSMNKDLGFEAIKAINPYMPELFYRSKALFINSCYAVQKMKR